jgi:hypothetical protein
MLEIGTVTEHGRYKSWQGLVEATGQWSGFVEISQGGFYRIETVALRGGKVSQFGTFEFAGRLTPPISVATDPSVSSVSIARRRGRAASL